MLQHDQVPETAVGHRLGGLLHRGLRGAEHDVVGGVRAHGLPVRIVARADGVEDVALGQDADSAVVGVEDDGRADAPAGHQAGRLPEGVCGSEGEDHGAHCVTDEHEESHLLG
ncbi:hypothetical protein GCM10010343_52730 [Streptomyces avidinii]|nr:hypothetical protein GCM10010343_52730 [Streptomyces avidinii]